MYPLMESISRNYVPSWTLDELRTLHTRVPTATFSMPDVNLPIRSWNQPLRYTQSGSVDFPTALDAQVLFPVPFAGEAPSVRLQPHPSSATPQCEMDLLATMAAVDVEQDYFNVRLSISCLHCMLAVLVLPSLLIMPCHVLLADNLTYQPVHLLGGGYGPPPMDGHRHAARPSACELL